MFGWESTKIAQLKPFFDKTVISDEYNKLLKTKFLPFAHDKDMITDFTFMQDGATPHRTREAFETINSAFCGRVLPLHFNKHYPSGIDWPPYSPDLNPCDFFLWGYLKDQVYHRNPNSIPELVSAVKESVETIETSTLESVIGNFEKRLRAVIQTEGDHFEHIII